ncbi:porin, partial [Noviherbaspirillum malthae]|uniref:porin n=1 Tax=Noviherbaspirillum malthae TaxID=1260987 RepID=UPI00188E2939
MKKSLIALAVLGTVAGASFAQTNVTVYGVADAGLARIDNGRVNTTALQSGQQSGSRIGFRGTEDLGGGLSAIFTLENGFNIDDGTLGQGGRLFGRQAFVGLQGGFGAVKLGRQYNPIRTAVENIDPFGLGLAGNA